MKTTLEPKQTGTVDQKQKKADRPTTDRGEQRAKHTRVMRGWGNRRETQLGLIRDNVPT